jgi:hypothetical protein
MVKNKNVFERIIYQIYDTDESKNSQEYEVLFMESFRELDILIYTAVNLRYTARSLDMSRRNYILPSANIRLDKFEIRVFGLMM